VNSVPLVLVIANRNPGLEESRKREEKTACKRILIQK
jgi:hypothetical protein